MRNGAGQAHVGLDEKAHHTHLSTQHPEWKGLGGVKLRSVEATNGLKITVGCGQGIDLIKILALTSLPGAGVA